MPELHKNQIQWAAPEPQTVSLDKPDYTPLANALNRLADTSDRISKSEQQYLNNKLIKDLEDVNTRTKEAFENEDSLNGNYTQVAENAIKEWQDTFNSMDDATKNRFLRDNPHAAEEFEISVKLQANEKRTKQIYNRSKLDIAQMSSSIVNAPIEMQDELLKQKRREIQDLNLPIAMTDDLLFSLQSEVDDYQIANFIANGYYDAAKDALKNGLPTKGAAERANLWQQLQNKIKADSYEKAQQEKILEEAKEQGKDADSKAILRLHQNLLMLNNMEAADKIRLDYYYGRDIEIPDENGRIINVIHSSDTDPVLRDKLFNTMLTSAKRSPFSDEYRAQYLADFNRLASGLMKSDGSLDLESDEYVSPEQYDLALKLRKKTPGWDALEKDQQVFIDNVLRAYGTEAGLYMIDLNPKTEFKATSFTGLDYQKANPVLNYQALLNLYNTPAGAITSALSGNTQLTGRESDTVSYYADEYEKEKFKGNYKISKGTRPDALATLFTLIATKNNPYGMQDVGLGQVPRENFEGNMVRYMTQIKQNGLYDTDARYEDLVQDFKNVYKMTTGIEYMPPKDTNPLQKYAILAIQARTGSGINKTVAQTYRGALPKDAEWERKVINKGVVRPTGTIITNEYNETLRKSNKAAVLERDRQRAKLLEKEEVSTFKPVEPAIKKTQEPKRPVASSKITQQYVANILGETGFENEIL